MYSILLFHTQFELFYTHNKNLYGKHGILNEICQIDKISASYYSIITSFTIKQM